jgi:PTS system mannitol-specific IIC component
MTSTTAAPAKPVSARVHVQKFGTFLSNMIMPNIAAIIAWGLITAFFIPVGWTPNEKIATIVGPAILYALPILIAFTGGKNVYGTRGGVVGGFAVMGVIMATSAPVFIGEDGNASPMFIGAMIMGPLAAYVMKRLDALWDGKIKPGFEMLVNNFSAGIWAALASIAGMFLLAPVLRAVITALGNGVNFLVENNLLPLTSILIEPAKIFFLNNAINHGVLTPLGIAQAAEEGKSVLFLLEANPGPGLGLLLAYMFFGKGVARASAPGAAIIHFFGGIHEIYFPYVLAKPRLILAMVIGGMTGVFVNVAFDTGLVAPAAPGSIFAVYAATARGSFVGVTLAVALSALVTLVVAAFLLKLDKGEDISLDDAIGSMEEMKGKKSIASSALVGAGAATAARPGHAVRSIVFACDAGMGSSAMGASVLRRKVQAAGFNDVTVVNKAIAELTDDVDLLVTHQDLAHRAAQRSPSAALYTVDNFMASPVYDEIVEHLQVSNVPVAVGAGSSPAPDAVAPAPAASSAPSLLAKQSIRLNGTATTRDEAITEAGELLVAAGAVDASYVESMHERERSVSTFMGNGLAIPHGTNEAKGSITRSALSFVRYSDGVDWNGKPATFVVAIAGQGDDHLAILSNLSKVFLDKTQIAALEAATTPEQVLEILGAVQA